MPRPTTAKPRRPGPERTRSVGGGKPAQVRRPPGLDARQLAVACLVAVLDRGHTLEDGFESAAGAFASSPLEARDRAFARLLATTVLRRKGELDAVLGSFIEKPLPEQRGPLSHILRVAAAQLLVLATPAHAAISLAVDQTRADRYARRFDRLTNAVLRRVATDGAARLAGLQGATLNIPAWRYAGWEKAFGAETARRIAEASLAEAPLDLSVKSEPEAWAERLGGKVLGTGSVRLEASGRIEDLPGFGDGAWWVQDAAAALPARLFRDVRGKDIADLCAAPGGKTAQLAAAGGRVTAVDLSPERLKRLAENLARLQLEAELVASDVLAWEPGRAFDAVLLDVPCTSTGTIRRHPDILYLKRGEDTTAAAALQSRLLDAAAKLVKPGGLLVYCTCSLEPEEGERQIERFLDQRPDYRRQPISAAEIGADSAWINPHGDLRTLPFHCATDRPGMSGMDGFFAARLVRSA
jgi:16S rRNA (cytosine967-C5)-methyltransferase